MDDYNPKYMDRQARAMIESAFTNAIGQVPPEQFALFLEEIDGGCEVANVALCAIAQVKPAVLSERVDDFAHQPWCEVGRYADRFELAHARCPTCMGGLKEGAK